MKRDHTPEPALGGEPLQASPPRFRRTLLRVLGMQLFSLLVLWLLQARYAH